MPALNDTIAGRLDEVARLLGEQGANRFRVEAYRHAATTLRSLRRPVSECEEHYRGGRVCAAGQLELVETAA
jgi:DNA polymerase (family X)